MVLMLPMSKVYTSSNKKVTKEMPPTSRPAGALRFSERMGVQETRSQQQVAQTNLHSNPLFLAILIASDGGLNTVFGFRK